MTSSLKNEVTVSDFEGDGRDLRTRVKARIVGTVHGLRVAMTLLALLTGITTLGLSANSLAVYKYTHVPDDYLLALWPEHFDLRPTTALIAGSAIVTVANAVSLLASKTSSVRNRPGAHASVSLAAPIIGFIAALVAMALFYAVNSSTTVDTFQSWTCRWKQVGMAMQPHFGSLCRQSEAGLILAILLVPLELSVLVTACFQMFLERNFNAALRSGGSGSPAMS
ncbi:ATP-dependent RNA helicase DBP10 [Purpureocillium lavendulum]|uniref:ATP-dependent RNA helicase DBP10 n=1 Tax=Purpureocillium lavendulum TaxID=1247861 RepID=A0AB34G271_9HYPO|nr:ATP-dependent RNA helicase DBP10 [Purpureocillium lavendulum]